MGQRPAPFARPSIDLSGAVKRDWVDSVPVYSLEEGDIVPGKGKVVLASDAPEGLSVLFANGERVHYLEGDTVRAFVKS